MLNAPNVRRKPIAPGLALVGDAALAPDPMWGNGISWALQSAAWLVEETAVALQSDDRDAIDAALRRYQGRRQEKLDGRFARDVDYAQVRPFNLMERLTYAAAVQDASFGQYTGPHSLRPANLRHLLPPQAVYRALGVVLGHQIRRLWQRDKPTLLASREQERSVRQPASG